MGVLDRRGEAASLLVAPAEVAAPYEVMAGVYNLVKVNGKWAISELWTFEDARAPPGQVSMQGFEDVPEPDAASRPGWYDQI